MGVAIGTLLLTVFIGVVIYSLLAFVSGKTGGCCGQVHNRDGEGGKPPCCTEREA